jgi:copper chaperone NosL
MKKNSNLTRIGMAVAALALLAGYFTPLWQILMWAPQYPEGLAMQIWIDDITGDVKVISALNHYIGMRHIEVNMFPEFAYMKYLLGALIGAGLIAAALNRRIALFAFTGLIYAAGAAALVDFYLWGYDYGHNLDPNAAIKIPGMVYQPPVIGTKVLLNFTAFSGPHTGGWIFMGAGVMLTVLSVWEFLKGRKADKAAFLAVFLALAVPAYSCSAEPQAIVFGTDACHQCKMTIVDRRFGGEVVSNTGKVFKFDDARCMIDFLNSGSLSDRQVAYRLIVDFSNPGTLVPAPEAFFLRSSGILSPMNGQVAAFTNEDSLEAFKKEVPGIFLTWGELITAYK